MGRNVLAFYEASGVFLEKDVRFIVAGNSQKSGHHSDDARVTYVRADYADAGSIRQLFDQYEPDEVFHFVSATVPANSNQNIRHDIETNLLGTIAVLECMVQHQVGRITYLSSGGAIYGDMPKSKFQEDDFNIPNNSYGIVKLTIEKYIHLFHKLYKIDYLILRVSNPFGVYHVSQQNGLINIALRKAVKGESIAVWGDGLNTKDYLFAGDFARIFWDLYQKGVKNQILNIGSGRLYSILDILTAIQEMIPDLRWTFEPAKSFDTKNVSFSLEALQKIMPLENTDFREALRATWEWERSQHLKTASAS